METNFKKLYKKQGGVSYLTGNAKILFDEYRTKNLKPKIKLHNVVTFLSKQVPYTVHRSARDNFPRNKFYVKFIGDVLAGDLADLKTFKEKNDGYAYILCIIDCFSKKAYAEPLKDKTAENTLNKFKIIKKNIQYKIHNLAVDNGGEFRSSFANFCKKSKINLYQVQGTMKNAIIERFIQTLKTRLFRYIRLSGTHRWIDILPKILETYNKSYHRSIKMTPNDVSVTNSHIVYKTMFPGRVVRKPKKFRVGDIVRISKTYKKDLQKAYEGRWSLAVYRIKGFKYTPRGMYAMYCLEEAHSKKAFGNYWFYGSQLQKVDEQTFASPETKYELQVLKKAGKYSLIKWLDYHDTKPVWILSSKIGKKKH